MARRDRERRLQSPAARRRARRRARSWCCARIAAICCRPACRSARPTWSARSPRNAGIAQNLVRLFETQFDPDCGPRTRDARREAHRARSAPALDAVTSLDEDRILRAYLTVVQATLRTNFYQPDAERQAEELRLLQARSAEDSGPAAAAAEVRDLRVQPARRRRAPAHGLRRARRHPLVRPARRLPHRSARADEGAEREEHRHRAGGREGRLRAEAPAGRAARSGAGRRRRVLPDIHPRAARRHGQHRRTAASCRRRASCAATATMRISSSRRTRARRRSPTSPTPSRIDYGFWLGDAFASGGSAGYDHKKMGITARGGVGVREAPLPRDRRGHPVAGLHGHRHRRHVGRRVRQRHAAVAAHAPAGGVQSPAHLPRPGRRMRRRASRSASGCSTCRAPPGTTTTARRSRAAAASYSRAAKSITLSPAAQAMLGLDAATAAPNEIIRAILRMPVDLLWNGGIGTYVKASRRVEQRSGRPRQRCRAHQRQGAAREGRRRRRQSRLLAARARRIRAGRRPAQHGLHRQLRRA